ncbi:PREDICTED: TM2 domain-containing protein CG10795 [Nicrophorus vespilloides]|uniref:TM2 domain-containing protein CG10795 n=1 Tax=Nicrophorus vespilloides TaxID=110193 RepID=A0ABM1MTJ2_NICVS|nr:PREDICTED: TM2 domain-containing protein CG10795 [Nicrophorus vespilloides]
MLKLQYFVLYISYISFVDTVGSWSVAVKESSVIHNVECKHLRMGQFMCPDPSIDHIDPKTQQLKNCQKNNKAKIQCTAVEGLNCTETGNSTFFKEMPCKWTNGYSFETSMLLSVFLGMFGADRFYLGYPAIGLAKFCTLGFMFIGQLIDIVLIATQYVGPADGSHYVMPYYGPAVEVIRSDNWTYRLRQDDW